MLEEVGLTQEELGGEEEQGKWCKYSDHIWSSQRNNKTPLSKWGMGLRPFIPMRGVLWIEDCV